MARLLLSLALLIVPPSRGGEALTVRGGHAEAVREPVGNVANWTCIHSHEAAWNADTGNGYHGGLQMDWSFMRAYGRDMLLRYGAAAEAWTPRDQMVVAERARKTRGYYPWPQTARMCGLI